MFSLGSLSSQKEASLDLSEGEEERGGPLMRSRGEGGVHLGERCPFPSETREGREPVVRRKGPPCEKRWVPFPLQERRSGGVIGWG